MKAPNIISSIHLSFKNKILKNITQVFAKENKQKETEERLKSLYDIAIQTRNFEITQLVQRNNFFMIFQGVLFACIIYSSNTVPFIHLMLCVVGMYISYSQTKVAAGAKYWQEFWENKVIEVERKLSDFYKQSKELNPNSLDFYPFFTTPSVEVRAKVIYQFDKKKTLINKGLISKENKSKIINHLNLKIKNIKLNKKNINLADINVSTRLKKHLHQYRCIKIIFIFKLLLRKIYIFFSIYGIVLDKPSVSKIPIRVGRALFIIWMILALSTVIPFNNLIKNFESLKGFPTHEDAAKREITNVKPIKLEIIKE